MSKPPADPPILASPEALFRYRVVSLILADLRRGYVRAEAVRHAAATDWWTDDGKHRRVSTRTLYRWLKSYEDKGLEGLEPASRARTDSSVVLPKELLDLLELYKTSDPTTSVPEVIRIARELGTIDRDAKVDRTTLYRAACRMGLPVHRRKKSAKDRDARRFAHPHRMICVLCDGKHFRAGVTRARRVALFFLDDATRRCLHVVVGTSENVKLFLRGLYEMLRAHGLFVIIFIDKGPGFIGNDVIAVVKALGAVLIHGETAYPEGHGKIERFHQTADRMLAGLDKRADVDPDCGALELRLRHWLDAYNHTKHESLGGDTPWRRWQNDPRPLRMPDSDAALRGKFISTFERSVTADNIVPVQGVHYEMPRGYAGTRVTLYHRLLEERIACLHEGRLVDLAPVDLHANAHARRARPPEPEAPASRLPSAADIAFQRDYAPVVDADGGYTDDLDSKE